MYGSVEQSYFYKSKCSSAARLNREKDLKDLIPDGRDEKIPGNRKITESRYEIVRAVGRAILWVFLKLYCVTRSGNVTS